MHILIFICMCALQQPPHKCMRMCAKLYWRRLRHHRGGLRDCLRQCLGHHHLVRRPPASNLHACTSADEKGKASGWFSRAREDSQSASVMATGAVPCGSIKYSMPCECFVGEILCMPIPLAFQSLKSSQLCWILIFISK